MTILQAKELNAFYCYAQEDQAFCEQLEQHLTSLKKRYRLNTWSDQLIIAGENREKVLEERLHTADLIFLLISAAFLVSDSCYGQVLPYALARHSRGDVRVIPIYLRPVLWNDALFGSLQMLPKDAVPVALWSNHDAAFYDIVLGIREVITDLLQERQNQLAPLTENSDDLLLPYPSQNTTRMREEWIHKGQSEYRTDQNLEALDAFVSVSHIIPADMQFALEQGDALHKRGAYQEAVAIYMQVIYLNANTVMKSPYKGDAGFDLQQAEEALAFDSASMVARRTRVSALLELQRYKEALQVCEQMMYPGAYIIAADYSNNAYALMMLERYEEALLACEHAIRLKPRLAVAHKNRACALNGLERYTEALLACKQTVSLKPDLVPVYALMGIALFGLQRYQEASAVFAQWSELFALERDNGKSSN